MELTTLSFALFAGALLHLYYLVRGDRQWQVLLGASMVFYIWAGLRYFFFLYLTAASSFFTARALARNQIDLGREARKKNRPLLFACLVLNFGLLAGCKLFLLYPDSGCFLSLGLPLGISFYCFQSMGYLLDIYRGREAEPSFCRYLLFVSYFPQLVQGPISKHCDLAHQLTKPHPYDRQNLCFGLQRMLWGYFKKLVIADRLAPAVGALRDAPPSGASFFLLTFFYALQIYADFTGGMDIVLGLSQALGITLPENFCRPFFSRSIAEYWRRWHITLGAWMREYIFFPLSISKPLRKLSKAVRGRHPVLGRRLPVYIATFITWFATGIWHGLTPNFILWGMLNCTVILLSGELSPVCQKLHHRFGWKQKGWYAAFEILRTFLLMNLIRACDLFPNVGDYFLRIGSLLRPWQWQGLELPLTRADYGILAMGFFLMLLVSLVQEKGIAIGGCLWNRPILQELGNLALLLMVLLLGIYGVGHDPSSFIYNQF